MEIKKVLILIVGLMCILSISNYFLVPENHEKIITINEVELTVPNNNFTVTNTTEHYSFYEDMDSGVKIYVFDSQGTNIIDAKEMFNFLSVRDINQLEVVTIQEKNYTFNYSSSLNEYTYLLNKENINMFIITKNKEDMTRIIKEMKIKNENRNESNDTKNNQEKIIENTVNYHPN